MAILATAADATHMARALLLAERGLFTTSPNPRVGCVVVRDDLIIGEGHHQEPGGAHAEVAALADAVARGHDPRGATVYVNLEPCNHHGRTPPCVDALLAAGVARVVFALHDPNTEAGGGAARLRAAGVVVESGPGSDAARELNLGFVSRMKRGRPWVRTKCAASLDGRTALPNGDSQWITGATARADGHAWRARASAILTGIGTVLKDDPQMTVRAVATPRQPLRVIVDRHAKTPVTARILEGEPVLIVTNGARNPDWPASVDCVALPDGAGRIDLPALLALLATRGVNELHVEAGAGLNGALLAAGLVDEWLIYLAPLLLGDPARGICDRAAPLAELAGGTRLAWQSVERVGEDLRIVARAADAAEF